MTQREFDRRRQALIDRAIVADNRSNHARAEQLWRQVAELENLHPDFKSADHFSRDADCWIAGNYQ